MAETVLKTFAAVVAALVALKLLVLLFQPSLAFYPVRGLDGTPAKLGAPFRDLTIPTSDGQTINAWLLPHEQPRAQVLYFHGNGGNLWLWSPILLEIQARGMTVLAVDYRGYGNSTGRPSEQGLYRDTEAVVDYFRRELHAPGPPVVYWGRSLGTTMAAYATTSARPDGLILEGGFPDAAALLASSSPLLRVLGLFSSYRFPTARFANERRRGVEPTPALVLHGDADSVVPYELGRRLFESLQGEKRFHRIRGDHNDVGLVDSASYWQAVLEFVDRLPRSVAAAQSGERI